MMALIEILKAWWRPAWRVGLLLGGSLVLAALILPLWFNLAEAKLGVIIPYEGAMRAYLALTMGLALLAAALWRWLRWIQPQRNLWWTLTATYVVVLAVFGFDRWSYLKDEYSWIRYPTALALFIAALVGLAIARRCWAAGGRRGEAAAWLALGLGFAYGGLDELAQIHERIGHAVEVRFGVDHIFTDFITAGYALAALLALGLIWRYLGRKYLAEAPWVWQGLLAGVVAFGIAQGFDTLDVKGFAVLKRVGVWLASRGHQFPDAWYLFYWPNQLFNSMEEVLECVAGALFGFTAWRYWRQLRGPAVPSGIEELRVQLIPTAWWPRLRWGFASIVVILLAIGAPAALSSSSPFLDGRPAQTIATAGDGLFHTDDLFWHRDWGLLIANEGPGTAYRYQNGKLERLPDPQRVLRDVDSVTADKDAVYFADGRQGKLIQYTEETEVTSAPIREGGEGRFASADRGRWDILLTRSKEGLRFPEGIAVRDRALYFVDESINTVQRIDLETGTLETYKPNDPDWLGPEGIAWHAQWGRFMVTDDKSGSIWLVDFDPSTSLRVGNGIKKFAGREDGVEQTEDIQVLPDGDVLVTENKRGEIVRFGLNGRVKDRWRVRRVFRDLQGLAVDDSGNLFFVSADDKNLASFMPSFVWKSSFN